MVNSRVFAIGFRDVDLAVRVLVLAEAVDNTSSSASASFSSVDSGSVMVD